MIGCANEADPEKKSNAILKDWEISRSPLGFYVNSRGLFFINSEIGFVVGYNGDMYKTVNAGETWQKKNSGTDLHLTSVYFVNENTGFVSGQAAIGCLNEDCDKGSMLLHTVDGGETWTKSFFRDYTALFNLKFFNEDEGLAIVQMRQISSARNEFIARTEDGGASWELIDLPIRPVYQNFMAVNDLVWIAGEEQRVFRTSDRGLHWNVINTPVEAWNEIQNLYFIDEHTAFLDDASHVYKTTDGGSSWETANFPFSSFGHLHFYNEYEGFSIRSVGGYEGGELPLIKGTVGFQTKDGGVSWEQSDLGETMDFLSTFFPRKDLGYAINHSEFFTIRKKN